MTLLFSLKLKIEIGKVLPNRLHLFLALKWISTNFCVILYRLFNGLFFGHFPKEKQITSTNSTMCL